MRCVTWSGDMPRTDTEALLSAIEHEADIESPTGTCMLFVHPRDLPPPVRDLKRGHFFVTDVNCDRRWIYIIDRKSMQ